MSNTQKQKQRKHLCLILENVVIGFSINFNSILTLSLLTPSNPGLIHIQFISSCCKLHCSTYPLLNMSAMEGCLVALDDRRPDDLRAFVPPFFTWHTSTSSSLLHIHTHCTVATGWAAWNTHESVFSSLSTQAPPNMTTVGHKQNCENLPFGGNLARFLPLCNLIGLHC